MTALLQIRIIIRNSFLTQTDNKKDPENKSGSKNHKHTLKLFRAECYNIICTISRIRTSSWCLTCETT